MRRRKIHLAGLFLLPLFIAFAMPPGPTEAAVKEVTFFPASAGIVETVKISAQGAGTGPYPVTLVLPPQADPESLTVAPPARVKIEDIQIKSVTRTDEERIARLRAELKKSQSGRKDLQARLQALDVQLQFWQAQTKAKTKSVAEADQLAAAIGKNSRRILADKNALEADLEMIDKKIKELQDQIQQATGKKDKAWEAVVSLSGAAGPDALLRYSYTLSGCGWQPLYRLEAQPSSNRILFSWEAEIWQSAGEDWKQAEIRLATLAPPKTIVPPEWPPWIIKPRTPAAYRPQRTAKSMQAASEAFDNEDVLVQAAPVEMPRTGYSLWSLGKKNVAAGSRQRFKIREDTWPAQFLYLARPSLSAQTFLRGKVKLHRPVDIPSGQASFVMDGAMIGKRSFSLTGSEADIYFGASPFVTVTSSIVSDRTGAATLFQNKQTRQWQWVIEAKNTGSTAVRVRIEEPVPQPRDERIKLAYRHKPEPSEKDAAKFVWVVDVPALQKTSIDTSVELEAPQDMVLDFGWRN